MQEVLCWCMLYQKFTPKFSANMQESSSSMNTSEISSSTHDAEYLVDV